MNAEFNWWLLIVGLVIGAGLVYLVLADSARRDVDVADEELPIEATWIATVLRAEGARIDAPTAERVLQLHRAYLAGPPPDDDADEDRTVTAEGPIAFAPPPTLAEQGDRGRGAAPRPPAPSSPPAPARTEE